MLFAMDGVQGRVEGPARWNVLSSPMSPHL